MDKIREMYEDVKHEWPALLFCVAIVNAIVYVGFKLTFCL